ncbi:MAG: hypothetical protein IANPNBLG_01176 [Bryobacteraceae bacterium]|nr:hypothetical protein [Bryobacteraceae bacterium]
MPFEQLEVAGDAEIPLLRSRPDDDIAAGVAERVESRQFETIGVEPAIAVSRSRKGTIASPVGPRGQSNVGAVARGDDRHRTARLEHRGAAQLPAPRHLAHHSAGEPRPPRTERELKHIGRREAMPDVNVRQGTVAVEIGGIDGAAALLVAGEVERGGIRVSGEQGEAG